MNNQTKTTHNQDALLVNDDPFIERDLEPTDTHSVIRAAEAPLPTDYGKFTAVVYQDLKNHKEHMLLKMGDVSTGAIVRVHSECLTGDLLGSQKCDCGSQLELALKKISAEGKGALLYMRQEGRGIGLANKMKAYALQAQGVDTLDANLQLGLPADGRRYAVAAEMLKQEGIDDIQLMTNNPLKIEGLKEHGINVLDRVSHEIVAIGENDDYLHTKAERMGHILTFNGAAVAVKDRDFKLAV